MRDTTGMDERVKIELDDLYKIAENEGRNLRRDDVLKFAKANHTSAIWKLFDERELWDDEKAANIARLEYAGSIIMSYKVTIREDGENKPFRATFSFTHAPDNERGYVRTDTILKGEDRKRMIRTLVARVRSEIANYPLRELKPILAACDAVVRKLK
jgi:hypothetical protein